MKYTVIFHGCKNYNFEMKKYIFLILAQNIDCGYMLEPPQLVERFFSEAVQTSTHKLCLEQKLEKNVYPCEL